MGTKIVIIGNGGSGKSTLAKKLAVRTGYPLYHLDLLTFNEDGSNVSEAHFTERLNEILVTDQWIVEGWSYQSTMQARLSASDTIIYLDYPIWICYWNALKRTMKSTFRHNEFSPVRTSLWPHTVRIAKAMWRVHTMLEPKTRVLLEEYIRLKFYYHPKNRRELKLMWAMWF